MSPGRVRSVSAPKGVEGVDLYISTFGPALSVISRQWPVLTSEVNPETGDPRQAPSRGSVEFGSAGGGGHASSGDAVGTECGVRSGD